MKEWYEVISIVWIPELQIYGSVENLGVYGSIVKYQKDGIEVEELLDNEDFTVMDEIVFTRVEDN
jgi:hypothetical protein